MKKTYTAFALVALLTPLLVSAQLDGTKGLIQSVSGLVDLLLTLVAGIALLVFFWGLAKFIFAQGNETAKTDGKKVMIWGLVALFVMVSVWGIVAFFQRELGLPVTVPGSGSSSSVPGNIIDPINLGPGNSNPLLPQDNSGTNI